MADKKISALAGATTPLAGTEVLPIVQSGTTKQVSVANLTAGRAISATQLTLTTGNLIVASGQGIDFSATPGTGTSELLNDYEEGAWTPEYEPDSGAFTSISYGFNTGKYIKIGNLVYVTWFMRTSGLTVGTASGPVYIKNLPFTVANASPSPYFTFGIGNDFAVNNARSGGVLPNTTQILLKQAFNNVSIVVTDLGLGGADNFTAGAACYYVL